MNNFENRKKKIKCELYRDSMQNYKKYAIPPAQLIIADVPYNVGKNFYGSNPSWYIGGDNKNGESKLAGKAAFNSDFNFNLYEYFHFCSKMLKKEDTKPIQRGRSSNSPCMIVFCSFEQIQTLIKAAGNFKQLLDEFQIWFDSKRRDFRMAFDITDSKKQILENGKRPLSHGGVANLLKTLTKTMEKQGSSIESIAKVQYTICMQAGIYIPDEFIEDVAVALYTQNEVLKNEQ